MFLGELVFSVHRQSLSWDEGDHIYAFGHRFLDAGPSDIPFARAEVLALLPNVSSSFKISVPLAASLLLDERGAELQIGQETAIDQDFA